MTSQLQNVGIVLHLHASVTLKQGDEDFLNGSHSPNVVFGAYSVCGAAPTLVPSHGAVKHGEHLVTHGHQPKCI